MDEKISISANDLPSDLVAALLIDARRRSERDEVFWSGQRTAVRARIRAHVPRGHPLRITFAGAVILFLAVILSAPAGSPPHSVPPAASVDPDQQLLIAVEHALASSTPQSLAPLSPFEQPHSTSDKTQTIPHKEHRNED